MFLYQLLFLNSLFFFHFFLLLHLQFFLFQHGYFLFTLLLYLLSSFFFLFFLKLLNSLLIFLFSQLLCLLSVKLLLWWRFVPLLTICLLSGRLWSNGFLLCLLGLLLLIVVVIIRSRYLLNWRRFLLLLLRLRCLFIVWLFRKQMSWIRSLISYVFKFRKLSYLSNKLLIMQGRMRKFCFQLIDNEKSIWLLYFYSINYLIYSQFLSRSF